MALESIHITKGKSQCFQPSNSLGIGKKLQIATRSAIPGLSAESSQYVRGNSRTLSELLF